MQPFDHTPRTRIVFGEDAVDRIGALAAELGGRHVLLVSDQGLARAGHVEHVRRVLTESDLTCLVYDHVHENPTTRDVEACLAAARDADPPIDLIVGLGGGSCIDAAKGCNFLLTNGGTMADYRGRETASRPMLPLIAVPTTAGTGSEMQSFALIAEADTHRKMACGDPKAAPRIAILDPALARSQPRFVAACTGLDAITHAVESAVTTRRTAISALYAREAFRLVAESFPAALAAPDDMAAQGRMLLGAAYAGTAIENSMLGAAHSMANPLTARYDIAHGQAVGMCLPHVVAYNQADPAAAAIYADLAASGGLLNGSADACGCLVRRLHELLETAGMPPSLADLGVEDDAVPELAAEAAAQWTARFNPRPVSADDFAGLYRAAMRAG